MRELSLIEVICRISLAPALVAFLFAAPAATIALWQAWRAKFETARSYGWFGLKLGGAAGLWMTIVTAGLGFVAPWLFLLPAAMSAIALAHAHYYENSPKLSRYQFTIPTIMYATLAVAVIVAVVRLWTADYADYSTRDEYAANLARMDSISNVKLLGGTIFRYEKEVFAVQEIQFSLAGRPDTLMIIVADEQLRTCDSHEPLSRVVLHQVGGMRFRATVESSQLQRPDEVAGINVGPQGVFAEHFPFPLRSIDDIVDHYDEIVAILKTWPRQDQPGELTWEGRHAKYWAIDAGIRP